MPAEKSDAIILRVVEFSETSCIVTLLTRDFGKITAIAKGARRPKSPFEAAIDVLAICRIVFLHKTNAMSLLTEAKLEHRFRSGEHDLQRLYCGYYVVELLRVLTDEADPQPELFELTRSMIRQLDMNDFTRNDLSSSLLKFELGLLDLLGHLPMITRCANCGREKTTLSRVSFGLNSGGLLCRSCCQGKSNVVTVSQSAFELLLSLAGAQIGAQQQNSDNWNSVERVNEQRRKHRSWLPALGTSAGKMAETVSADFGEVDEPETSAERTSADASGTRLDFEVIREVRRLMNQYITHLIGYPPRLHKFLQGM